VSDVKDDGLQNEDNETEYERFQAAIARGRNDATMPQPSRPRRQTRSTRHDDYVYTTIAVLIDKIMDKHCLLTLQMSARAGLKQFGQKGATAIMQELGQLIVMDIIKGCFANQLTKQQKQKALRYLMFLKEKRCGRIKERGCAEGHKQRLYKTKEETSLPTVSVEALFLSCIIDAQQR
jgi:hypothetical protein